MKKKEKKEKKRRKHKKKEYKRIFSKAFNLHFLNKMLMVFGYCGNCWSSFAAWTVAVAAGTAANTKR